MKIIWVDNYARESVADVLLYEHLHPWIANWMLTEIQRPLWNIEYLSQWPQAVEDDYKLWRGMEELV